MNVIDAILKAYDRYDEHIMEELKDDVPITLFVTFRLGELRNLKRNFSGERVACEHSRWEPEKEPRPGG